MSTSNQPVETSGGPSTLARARFGPGMLLQHDDLEQLNVYTRELSRLMFRSLFGCGVVCGLVVTAKADCGKLTVTVDGGLALDCQGDPIHVPRRHDVVVNEACHPSLVAPLWVVLCGMRKCCAPRTTMCPADEDDGASACTRERDYFEIRIVASRPRCSCACDEPDAAKRTPVLLDTPCQCANPQDVCHAEHYGGKCESRCGDGNDCDCVLLARLDRTGEGRQAVWTPDHRVRRFVRPVLMRDPQVWIEEQARTNQTPGNDRNVPDEGNGPVAQEVSPGPGRRPRTPS